MTSPWSDNIFTFIVSKVPLKKKKAVTVTSTSDLLASFQGQGAIKGSVVAAFYQVRAFLDQALHYRAWANLNLALHHQVQTSVDQALHYQPLCQR